MMPVPRRGNDRNARLTDNDIGLMTTTASLDDFETLSLTSFFPTVRTFRRKVETYYGSWIPETWEFDMIVFYTPFRAYEPACRPTIVYLHPSQVFQVAPGGEYWKTCSYWATKGFLCILSAETSGQFSTGNGDAAAEGLGRRGLAMWRTLYAIENVTPTSIFFDRVCKRACVTGYSMGGGAAQNMAYYATDEDNVVCQAPMHAGVTLPRKVNAINIPTMIGSSRDDTVTPAGPIGLMYAASLSRPPVIQVILEGSEHIRGSLCGNDCPFDPICCIPGITNVVVHIKVCLLQSSSHSMCIIRWTHAILPFAHIPLMRMQVPALSPRQQCTLASPPHR